MRMHQFLKDFFLILLFYFYFLVYLYHQVYHQFYVFSKLYNQYPYQYNMAFHLPLNKRRHRNKIVLYSLLNTLADLLVEFRASGFWEITATSNCSYLAKNGCVMCDEELEK